MTAGIMALALIVIGITNYVLFRIALGEVEEVLHYTAQSHARFIEFFTMHERGEAQLLGRKYSREDSIEMYRAMLANISAFGDTGEFVVAAREKDEIVFLIRNRHENREYPNRIPWDGSPIAEPSMRALMGESGTVIAKDYRGEMVLAAYEPIPALHFAIVAKLDLAEVRGPYIAAATQMTLFTLAMGLAGAFLYLRLVVPLMPRLMEREETLSGILHNSSEGILTIDAAGIIRFANRAVERLFGYEMIEVVGQPLGLLLVNHILDTPSCEGSTEAVMRRRDGSEFTAIVSCRPWDHRDKPFATIIIEDISTWKQAQEDLKNSEEKYRSLIEGLNEGICVLDSSVNVSYVNNSMAAMLGYQHDELAGHSLLDFTDEAGREILRSDLAARIKGDRQVHRYELPLFTKDGKRMTALVSDTPSFDDKGKYSGTIAGIIDITERKKWEEELRRLNRMLTLLSQCNQCLVVAKDEESLLHDICRIIIDMGGYAFVNVGETPTAVQGSSLLPRLSLSSTDDALPPLAHPIYSHGPCCDALNSQGACSIQDIDSQNSMDEWRTEALARGYHSAVAIPLRFGNSIDGVLSIYSEQSNAFPQNEMVLLLELAEDLSLGIRTIRERRQKAEIEAEFRERERQMRDLLDNVQLIAVMIDREGSVLYCNDYFLRLSGWRKEEVLGKNWLQLSLPPELHDETHIYLKDLIANNSVPPHHENPIITKLGTRRMIHWNNTLIRDVNGYAIGITSLGDDVTERIANEASIREHLHVERTMGELSRLFASAQEADLNRVLELAGLSVHANRAYIFRLRRAENKLDNTNEWCALGTLPSIGDLHNIDASAFSWWLGKMETEGDIIISDVDALPAEAAAEKKEFLQQDIKSLASVPIRSMDGEIIGFIGFDDTEQKRKWRKEELQVLHMISQLLSTYYARTESMKRVHESELRFRALAQSTTDAIISINADGRIIFWNHGAEKIFGHTPEEALDNNIEMIIPEQYQALHKAGLKNIVAGGPPKIIGKTVTVEGKHKDGWEVPVEISLSTWSMGGDKYFTAIIRDITLRKQREDDLRNAQLLLHRTEKLASVGTLAAGVAHEILNPLNIIGTIAQILMMDERRGKIHESLQEVLNQIHRASKITNNLRMFAREKKMEIAPVDIPRLFDHTASLLEHDLSLDNITIERHYSPDAPLIMGDADQLAQVFMNLLTNARDAMNARRHGTITIHAVPAEDGIDIIFGDDGPGIPMEVLSKIFDPFFTTKEPGKGTGLGLSIVYRIIEDHGGRIMAENGPGGGAMFTIHLPRESPLASLQHNPKGNGNG